jgi:hypothetical protein
VESHLSPTLTFLYYVIGYSCLPFCFWAGRDALLNARITAEETLQFLRKNSKNQYTGHTFFQFLDRFLWMVMRGIYFIFVLALQTRSFRCVADPEVWAS